MSSSAPGRTCCAGRSRSRPAAAATHPRCCSRPQNSLEPLDVRLARETYLEALSAALFAGRLALGGGAREVAEAARAAPPPPQPARAPDLLLDGLALLITEGYPAGAPMLKQAVSAFRGETSPGRRRLRWLWLACPQRRRCCGTTRAGTRCPPARSSSPATPARSTALPIAAHPPPGLHLCAGEFAVAASLIAEVGVGHRGDGQPASRPPAP